MVTRKNKINMNISVQCPPIVRFNWETSRYFRIMTRHPLFQLTIWAAGSIDRFPSIKFRAKRVSKCQYWIHKVIWFPGPSFQPCRIVLDSPFNYMLFPSRFDFRQSSPSSSLFLLFYFSFSVCSFSFSAISFSLSLPLYLSSIFSFYSYFYPTIYS